MSEHASSIVNSVKLEPFEQLVFSGGGTRCFWHGGFCEHVRKPLRLMPKRITGASGGAMSAACFIAQREVKLLETMGAAFLDRDENISTTLNEIQEDGLTPHQRIYREVVTEVLDDDAIQAVIDGPQFQVLIAHPPTEILPKWSTFPMMAAYLLDLTVRSTPHVEWPAKLGADSSLVDAREAAKQGKLIDLICAAAVIPPVFNVEGWEGKKVIDGGMTSKAPLPSPDEGRTLILLTRRFKNLPQTERRLYIQPSDEVPADKIDFTDRDKLYRTWEFGEKDAHRFLAADEAGLFDSRGRG
ncbi:Patatin-like phospholipase family protein [Fulvimarina pelagi HTCC2506]|uniref:Patatin-like phospholipase family protein n=2 Tax=Fulvimarina pelagi TaxID=217511 RepID=Q0FZD9_9HYPH|nr:patatin-like phospholipase family protein [Fulvimarina pelagi]EAU40339.1 Patatin-like phospholipase family protein [Fulvimarina pelagi HTCC2506]BAT31376.1 patatin-like phospholipase family protein [Fulvimarina pelagi]